MASHGVRAALIRPRDCLPPADLFPRPSLPLASVPFPSPRHCCHDGRPAPELASATAAGHVARIGRRTAAAGDDAAPWRFGVAAPVRPPLTHPPRGGGFPPAAGSAAWRREGGRRPPRGGGRGKEGTGRRRAHARHRRRRGRTGTGQHVHKRTTKTREGGKGEGDAPVAGPSSQPYWKKDEGRGERGRGRRGLWDKARTRTSARTKKSTPRATAAAAAEARAVAPAGAPQTRPPGRVCRAAKGARCSTPAQPLLPQPIDVRGGGEEAGRAGQSRRGSSGWAGRPSRGGQTGVQE